MWTPRRSSINSPMRRSGRRRRTLNKDKVEGQVFPYPLPRKVLRKIFSFFTILHPSSPSSQYQHQQQVHWADFRTLLSLSRVNKAWRHAVLRQLSRVGALDLCPVLAHLTPTDARYLPTILHVNSLLRTCAQVHTVCLCNCSHAFSATITQLADSHNDTLASLFLEGIRNFQDSNLLSLAHVFPNLKFINVERTGVTCEGVCEFLRMQEFIEGVCVSVEYSSEIISVLQVNSLCCAIVITNLSS